MNFNNVFEELSKLYDSKSLTENFENDNGVKAWSKNAISYYEQAAKELGLVDYTMKMENRSGKDVAVITAMKNGKKLSAEESDVAMTNVKNVEDAKEYIQFVFPELSDVKEGIVDKVKSMFKNGSSAANGDTKWAVVDNKTGKTVLNNVSEQEAQDYVKKQPSADNYDVLPIKESCDKETLTEADDEEIEFAEEPVEIIPEEGQEAEEEIPEEDVNTVEEFLKSFGEYDGKLKLEFKPIVIDDKEYQVTGLRSDDAEEGKLVVEVVVDMPEAEEFEESLNEKFKGYIDNVEELKAELLKKLPESGVWDDQGKKDQLHATMPGDKGLNVIGSIVKSIIANSVLDADVKVEKAMGTKADWVYVAITGIKPDYAAMQAVD